MTALLGAAIVGASADGLPIYQDRSKPVEMRVQDALARMTVQEKVNELVESWGVPAVKRLGIPGISKAEAIHGVGYGKGATIFPHAIGMAATFDADLLAKEGDVIGQEAVQSNTSQAWCPVLDVARDARWARVEETFGEDPFLVSRMGVAWIKAFQAHNLIATPKHFAAHGGPLGGRDSNDVGYSERVLREVYLPPFRAAFEEAKAGAVMNAYSTWSDGLPDAESHYLLKGILREEWGFQGFDVSDCGSIENMTGKKFSVAADAQSASALAVSAGVSCNCGDAYKKGLLDAVMSGKVSKEDLDFCVGRILAAVFRLGLYDHPLPPTNWNTPTGWDSPEHRAVALQAARESVILLKNDNKLLPLSKTVSSIAVIGPNADEVQTGDYTCKALPGQLISILDGIKKSVSAATTVTYRRGCDQMDPSTAGFAEAVDAAQKSDVVVMVLGDKSEKTTGENRDRADLDLPGVQEQLLEAVAKTGKPIVLVLVTGKPCTVGWAAANVPAILETFYSGEEGGDAAANVLFGDYNPAGRLPITVPRNSNELPLYYNYMPSGRAYNYLDESVTPLFRFGLGLSYTTFSYSNLLVTAPSKVGDSATVSVDVTNTGAIAGDEVPQLYISHTFSSVVTPVMELKGFYRIHLKAGETQTVKFALDPYALSVLDSNADRIVQAGSVKIMVGGSSPLAMTSDGQKQKVGYATPDQGVNGKLDIVQPLKALFEYKLNAPSSSPAGQPLTVSVQVKNTGTMTDAGEVKLFVQGQFVASRRYEEGPGDIKTLEFPVTIASKGLIKLAAVGKYATVDTLMLVK